MLTWCSISILISSAVADHMDHLRIPDADANVVCNAVEIYDKEDNWDKCIKCPHYTRAQQGHTECAPNECEHNDIVLRDGTCYKEQ